MTSRDQQLARALQRQHEALTAVPDSPEARARTVAALQLAMSSEATPAANRRGPWRLALAAALPLLLGAGWWVNARRVSDEGRSETPHQTADLRPVETAQRPSSAEVVDSGPRVMTLAPRPGVTLCLQPQSSVELRDAGARVLVRRGEVAAEVTSLDQPFTVESFDAQVATRAGRVVVTPGAGCDGRSRVQVTAGAASINGVEVQAGETWPRCAPALEPEPPPVKKESPSSAPLAPRGGDLARQNALYQQAVALQRTGDVAGAVKKLEAVLADQRSPLAETALAQKMKWLSVSNRPAAREAAREYLERFPMGFGRADAETLVLEPP